MPILNYVPEVISTVPMHAATAFTVGATIEILWNTDIDSDTIEGRLLLHELGGSPLSITTWNYDDKVIKFYSGAMAPDTEYEVIVRSGVRSVVGQSMDSNYHFSFLTGTLGTLQAPTLIYPTNQSSVDTLPTLQWSTVTASTGYQAQLAGISHFWPELWSTVTTGASVTPDVALEGNDSYYWRVRALGSLGYGPWSETSTFYLGDQTSPAPPVVTYDYPQGFWLEQAIPDDGVKTSYVSLLTFTFNTTLTSLASLNRSLFWVQTHSVFGDPAYQETIWPGTAYINGNAVIYSPETTLLANNVVYEWHFSSYLESEDGSQLGTEVTGIFCGPLTPLLTSPRAVRQEYGPLYLSCTDETLWETIARVSLLAKYLSSSTSTNVSLASLNDLPFEINYSLVEYVKAKTAYLLGMRRLTDIATQIGRSTRLGDFSYDWDMNAYNAMDKLLQRLEDDSEAWEEQFSTTGSCEWVVRSDGFDGSGFEDKSFRSREYLWYSPFYSEGTTSSDYYHNIWDDPELTEAIWG